MRLSQPQSSSARSGQSRSSKKYQKDKQGKTESLKLPYQSVSSKLLYGLEFLLLTVAEQSMLDSFQMNMSRKSLGVPITHIDSAWTNVASIDELAHRYGYKHIRLSTGKSRRNVDKSHS